MSENGNIRSIHDSNGEGDRSTDDVRRDIDRRRDAILRTVDQAGRKVQDSLNWRERVGDHPYGTLAVAAGAGFVAASVLRHRQSPNERLLAAVTSSVEEISGSLCDSIDVIGGSRGGIARTVGATLIAIAVRSLLQAAVRPSVIDESQSRSNGRRMP